MQPWPWNWFALNCPWYLRSQRATSEPIDETKRLMDENTSAPCGASHIFEMCNDRLHTVLHIDKKSWTRVRVWGVAVKEAGHAKCATLNSIVYIDVPIWSKLVRRVISRKCYSRIAIYILEHSLAFSHAVHKLSLYRTRKLVLRC